MNTARGKQVEEEAQPSVGAPALCRHHWLIDAPTGPLSIGVCCICGEQRTFSNHLEGTYVWDDLSPGPASTAEDYLPNHHPRP